MRSHLAIIMTGMIAFSNAIPGEIVACRQEPQAPNKQPESPAATPAPATVKPVAACGFCLEDGTKVSLTLGRELSSAKESTGNRVDFAVSEDIRVNDVVVIPKGSLAYGTIVEAQAKRRMGRAGKLNVRIEEVRLADGSRAKLRAVREDKGKGRQGAMTAGIIGTGILFFPVAPLFLFMHGKDIVIAKDTPVVAYVDGNTELDAAKFGPVPKPSETQPPEEGPAKEKPEKPTQQSPQNAPFRLNVPQVVQFNGSPWPNEDSLRNLWKTREKVAKTLLTRNHDFGILVGLW